MPAAKPPSPRRFWLGAFFVLLALACLTAWAVDRQVDRAWEAMRETAALWEAELVAREDARPVLVGETSGDGAAALYREAFRLAAPLDEEAVTATTSAATEEERAARAQVLEEAAKALATLGEATRAADSGWVLDTGTPFGGPDTGWKGAMRLGDLLVARARRELEEGRPAGCVDTLLERSQFVRDLSASFLLIDVHVAYTVLWSDAFVALVEDGTLAGLPDDERARLERGLATLLERWPIASSAIEGELVGMQRQLESALDLGSFLSMGAGSYGIRSAERGWSLRWEVAHHFEHATRIVREFRAEQAGADLGAQHRLAKELDAAFGDLDNGVTRMTRPNFAEEVKRRAEAQVRLHLLVGALAVLRGADPREVVGDPHLAANLAVEETEDAVRLRAPDGSHSDWWLVVGR